MKHDYFLYLTTFISGAAIMATELTATRFLAPYYGSSMMVWTVLIGIILVAMSFGNYIGGIYADKPNAQSRLYNHLFYSAIWIALIPILGRYIITASFVIISKISPGNLITAGSALSCLAIFAPPCILLGTVAPGLIKLAVKDLEHNGRITGELFATTTLGSFIGTLLPTFVFIPYLGTAKTFYFISLFLVLISLIFRIKQHISGKKKLSACLILLLIAILIPYKPMFAFWKTGIEEYESLYNYIQVYKDSNSTQLSTHVEIGNQSVYSPHSLFTGNYWDYGIIAPYLQPDPKVKRILILGLGAGTFARQCRQTWPNCQIDGIEIDPQIINLGKQNFQLEQAKVNIHIEDARTYFRIKPAKYDLIFMDVFRDITIPFHLSTIEFFKILKQHINSKAVLVVNFNFSSSDERSLQKLLGNTINKAFTQVFSLTTDSKTNTVFIAGESSMNIKNLNQWRKKIPLINPIRIVADTAARKLAVFQSGKEVLTDDHSPVEYLSMKAAKQVITNK